MKVTLFRAKDMSHTSYAGYQWALAQLRQSQPDLEICELDIADHPEQAVFYQLSAARLPALVYDHVTQYAQYIAVNDEVALHRLGQWLQDIRRRPNQDELHYRGVLLNIGDRMLTALEDLERLAPWHRAELARLRLELDGCLDRYRPADTSQYDLLATSAA